MGGTWLALLDAKGLGQRPGDPIEWQRVHLATIERERMPGDWVHGEVFYLDCRLNDLEVTARALVDATAGERENRRVARRGHARVLRRAQTIRRRQAAYAQRMIQWRSHDISAHYAYRSRPRKGVRESPFWPLACLCVDGAPIEEGWLYPYRFASTWSNWVTYVFIPADQPAPPEGASSLTIRPLPSPGAWLR